MNNLHEIQLQTEIDFVMVFDLLMAFFIAYLWSSGAEYMIKAANDSGRSGKLDRIMLGAMGSACLFGAFIRYSWIPYFQIAPLFIHLLQITYLSFKFKHTKEHYKNKPIGRILSFLDKKPIHHN